MHSKTVLITGATSGIGLALAKQSIELGYTVVITGRNQTRLDQVSTALGVKSYLADSADLEQVRQLGASLEKDGIKLDGVVLNAGVFYPTSFAETTPSNFDETMSINTKGPFFTLQALLPVLSDAASIVFTSSIAVNKGFENCATYAASKAAFEAVIRVANIELADRGIRINSIRPGITATEIQAKAGLTTDQEAGLFDSLKSTPLGRALKADDHVGAMLYLLGDQSKALRNAAIDIDGGYLL